MSRRSRPLLPALVLTALWIAGALGLALPPNHAADAPFQRATGGIGLSYAVDARWSFFAFDPRLEGRCENELSPLPGLTCPNPHHGRAACDLPPRDAAP